MDVRLRLPRPDGHCREKTSGGTTLESVTYTYDALDNRIGMDENGTQTWTLYDGGTPIMDFNGSGSLTMRYLWGPTGIVSRQTSGGTVSWYLADQLGTVRDIINNSGAIIDHVDFSAFGTVLRETTPTNGDRMTGFAGMERDTVTGLNLAVNREENPGTGRWDTQEPFGFAGGDTNTRRYVGNAPPDSADPSGLFDEPRLLRPVEDLDRLFELFARYLKDNPGDTKMIRVVKYLQKARMSNMIYWVRMDIRIQAATTRNNVIILNKAVMDKYYKEDADTFCWGALRLLHEGVHLVDVHQYGEGSSIDEEQEAWELQLRFYEWLKRQPGFENYRDKSLEDEILKRDGTMREKMRRLYPDYPEGRDGYKVPWPPEDKPVGKAN